MIVAVEVAGIKIVMFSDEQLFLVYLLPTQVTGQI
jgi:hypothetical protein